MCGQDTSRHVRATFALFIMTTAFTRRGKRLLRARTLHVPCAVIAVLAGVLMPARIAVAQLRVVTYNVAQLQGDPANLENVFAAMHDDDKPGFAVPVGVFVFQEVLSTNVATLQAIINNAAPPGVTYALGTYTNNNEDDFGGAQAMFYRTDLLAENAAAHIDTYTGAGRRTDRWKLELLGYSASAAAFYIYSSHLKADTGAANQQERLTGATTIRNNADALGANQHILYCGDYNLYSNGEPAYLHMLSTGNGQALDPLGTGSWAGATNALKHSQSPRLNPGGGLIGGGLDDRFDFQFSTAAVHDNAGIALMNVPFVYRGLGNDGQHYNVAINSGSNSYYPGDLARSNALALDLHEASDHMPLIVDYQIPAMMGGAFPANFGRIIQGAGHSLSATITNPAPVHIALGGDVLDFTATGSLAISGSQAGSVEPLGDFDIVTLPLNTSSVGNATARITLTSTSQAVQPASLTLDSTGVIIRHADASFSGASDINSTTVNAEFNVNTGAHVINVPVHNFGYNALQALLDIDAASRLSSPFAFTGGLTSGIGGTPATLQFAFDTDGAAPGMHEAHVSITVSDEDLPGATGATLDLALVVTINGHAACEADISGDGMVNVDDLIAVILGWGACPMPPTGCAADVSGDGMVDADDLVAVILAWGPCSQNAR
jgi:hypothetical protein